MAGLNHLDEEGRARMVDVGGKPSTRRTARAQGRVAMSAEALAMLSEARAPKGDVLAVARVAGIMAAKRTAELIPLCHPLAIDSVRLTLEADEAGLKVEAEVSCSGPTGVEMEALTAVSVACLTLYDMMKAVDRTMVIGGIRLVAKEGGRSGAWAAES